MRGVAAFAGVAALLLLASPAQAQTALEGHLALALTGPEVAEADAGGEARTTLQVTFTVTGSSCDLPAPVVPPESIHVVIGGVTATDGTEGNIAPFEFDFTSDCGEQTADADFTVLVDPDAVAGSVHRWDVAAWSTCSEDFDVRGSACCDTPGSSAFGACAWPDEEPEVQFTIRVRNGTAAPPAGTGAGEGGFGVNTPGVNLQTGPGGVSINFPQSTVAPGGDDASPWWVFPLLAGVAVAGGAGAFLVLRRRQGQAPGAAAAGPGAALQPVPGAVFLGKYRVVRELGAGAFGTAWLAEHDELGRAVVIKQLHPEWAGVKEAAERFRREARILASLDHPRITRVYDVERVGGALYIVMEYVPGGTLEERLQRGALPLAEAAQLTAEVLDGLAFIHAHGVLHRDLKPSNILLTAGGEAKIADFGVARSATLQRTMLTQAGTPGTPLFMAPEQLRGEPGDARCDLYAVGATFYLAVAGQSYLGDPGTDLFQLHRRVLEQAPELPLPAAPEAVNAWLAKALAKDPAERFQDAAAMAQALREAAGLAGPGA